MASFKGAEGLQSELRQHLPLVVVVLPAKLVYPGKVPHAHGVELLKDLRSPPLLEDYLVRRKAGDD